MFANSLSLQLGLFLLQHSVLASLCEHVAEAPHQMGLHTALQFPQLGTLQLVHCGGEECHVCSAILGAAVYDRGHTWVRRGKAHGIPGGKGGAPSANMEQRVGEIT